MNGKLTDADLMVLVNALLNRLKYFDTVSSLSEIEILIETLLRLGTSIQPRMRQFFSPGKNWFEGYTEVRRCGYAKQSPGV
jgi:hypothetical protein